MLEENRRVINEHLASHGRGKASFTHIIGWAIVQAVKVYPHLNFGYGDVDGTPSRLEHQDVNLGIAIDIEKKDGSRNLLVPNIKAADKMNFAEFFDAYNERVLPPILSFPPARCGLRRPRSFLPPRPLRDATR